MQVAIEEKAGGPQSILRRFLARWPVIISAALICSVVAGTQISRHAYNSSLAEHPDEAAHFVSGVFVLDYFRFALGTNPMRFAEMYYARYPKVALGHWPPLFYVIQAAWYSVVGESAAHAILLTGIASALTALILLLRFQKLFDSVVALTSAMVFLWLPLTRFSELTLMTDMPAALFQLLAVWALCDACADSRLRRWLLMAAWTLAAVMTKLSALSLLATVPAALAVARGTKLPEGRGRQLGLAAAGLLLLVTAVEYVADRGRLRQAWSNVPNLAYFLTSAPPMMLAIAGYGAAGLVGDRIPRKSARELHAKIAVVWLVVALVSQLPAREAFEPRYLLPVFLPATLLFAEGLSRIGLGLSGRFSKPAIGVAVACVGTICIATSPAPKLRQRTGYDAIAAAIPRQPGGPVVLVSSDALGEGGMTAELLLDDPERSGVVVRATKALSSSDWMGRDYRLRETSAESVRQFLNSTPVHFLVMDMHGFTSEATRPHHRLLEETLRAYPEQFRLVGEFPLYLDGRRRDDAVEVYENVAVRGQRIKAVHIDMTSTLGRSLDVPLSGPLVPGRRFNGSSRLAAAGPSRPADFSIAPDSDRLPARGGMGRIYLTAPSAFSWSFASVPDWIHVDRRSGVGDATVNYEVGPNRSNSPRSAVLTIANATFQITQLRSATTYVPYLEDFSRGPVSVWPLKTPDPNSTLDPPSQWSLDDRSGRARIQITGEGLVLDKPGQTDGWKTRISLSRINLSSAKQYTATLRMKTDNPGLVWLTLTQNTSPSSTPCGLAKEVWVERLWNEFSVIFGPNKGPCSEEDNRLTVEAGKISGSLTIGRLSLTETR